MSYRLSAPKIRAIAMACAIGLVASTALRAADPTPDRRSIQFTVPRNDKVSTNVNELRDTVGGLKSLEEDLARPLQSFRLNPDSSLGGVAAAPIRPPRTVINPRLRMLIDRKHNWAYSTPDEILGATSG